MNPAESVQILSLTLWRMREEGGLAHSDWLELEGLTKAISSSILAQESSLNARLGEIEIRLSTLTSGLERLTEKLTTMPKPEASPIGPHHYLWSKTRDARLAAKPSPSNT